MKRFVAGLLAGLCLGAAPLAADWGWSDMEILKNIQADITAMRQSLDRIANHFDPAGAPIIPSCKNNVGAAVPCPGTKPPPKRTMQEPCTNRVGAVIPCPEAR